MESMILAVSLFCAMGSPPPLQAAEQARAAASREAYVTEARAAADALGAKIDALEAEASKSAGEARENAADRVWALNVRRRTLKKGLVRLARAGGASWTKVKAGVERDIDGLEKAYGEAVEDRLVAVGGTPPPRTGAAAR